MKKKIVVALKIAFSIKYCFVLQNLFFGKNVFFRKKIKKEVEQNSIPNNPLNLGKRYVIILSMNLKKSETEKNIPDKYKVEQTKKKGFFPLKKESFVLINFPQNYGKTACQFS